MLSTRFLVVIAMHLILDWWKGSWKHGFQNIRIIYTGMARLILW